MLPQNWKQLTRNLSFQVVCFLGLVILLSGCAGTRPGATFTKRPFNFQTDTFAFSNELVWEYQYDEHGKWTSHPRQPPPDYSHHCFVVARSARQFFEHARFDPAAPLADAATYRRLIRAVVARDASHVTPDAERIVVPGYADLRSFSAAQGALLKSECGGAWQSYFQRGHWRMIMPFSRHYEERMAAQFQADLKADHPPVVHLVRFPRITINHAVVLFDAVTTDKEIDFATYDPNNPQQPGVLIYDRAKRTFQFPANNYFPGGRVDVYEVYRDWRY